MAMARQAFDSLLSQLRHGQDEVAVFTFDSSLHERQQFTSDLGSSKGALDEFDAVRHDIALRRDGGDGAPAVASRSATHKAIIVLTDGIDTSSTLTAPEVSGLASSIDVPVYVVATVPSIDQRAMHGGVGARDAIGSRGPARSRGVDGRPAASSRARSRKPRSPRRVCRRTASALRARHRSRQQSTSGAASTSGSSARGHRQGAQRIFRRIEPLGPATAGPHFPQPDATGAPVRRTP